MKVPVSISTVKESSHPTVLLIDGNNNEREYWVHCLKQSSSKYVILEADNGETGLTVYRSQRVDCVVLELVLPDMSGFQVLFRLIPAGTSPQVAVIFLSRLKLQEFAELALENGAQAFLMKSCTSGADLDKAIQKSIAKIGTAQKGSDSPSK